MKKISTGIVAILLFSTATSFAADYSSNTSHRFVQKNLSDTGFVNGQRQIEYTKIPATIQQSVSNQYPNFTPSKMVTEVLSNGQSTYFISIENDNRIMALMSTADGELSTQSSSRKGGR